MKIYGMEDFLLLYVILAQQLVSQRLICQQSEQYVTALCQRLHVRKQIFRMAKPVVHGRGISRKLPETSNFDAEYNTLQISRTASSINEMRFVVPRPSEYLILFNQMSQIFPRKRDSLSILLLLRAAAIEQPAWLFALFDTETKFIIILQLTSTPSKEAERF